MVCEKLKFKITVYFAKRVHKILFHQNCSINKHNDRGAFGLQNIKRVGQSFYMLTIFFL